MTLDVETIRKWNPGSVRDSALKLAESASSIGGLRSQFDASTNLGAVWRGPASDAAQNQAQRLAEACGSLAEGYSSAAKVTDAWAALIEYGQAEIRSAIDSVSAQGLPLELGPDGKFPPVTLESATDPNDDLLAAVGYSLRAAVNPFDTTAMGVVETNRKAKPGWPADVVTRVDGYAQVVEAANTKIQAAVEVLATGDSQATASMQAAFVQIRAASIGLTSTNGVVAVKGDALWNMARDALTTNFGLEPSQATDHRIGAYISMLAKPMSAAPGEAFVVPSPFSRARSADHAMASYGHAVADTAVNRFLDGAADSGAREVGAMLGALHGVGEFALSPVDQGRAIVDQKVQSLKDSAYSALLFVGSPKERERRLDEFLDKLDNQDLATSAGQLAGTAVVWGPVGRAVGGSVRGVLPESANAAIDAHKYNPEAPLIQQHQGRIADSVAGMPFKPGLKNLTPDYPYPADVPTIPKPKGELPVDN